MTEQVLLLSPSRGMGGGIERFVSTVEAAFGQCAVSHERLDLCTHSRLNGTRTRLEFAWEVVRTARSLPNRFRLVLAHPNLLPVVRPVARLRGFAGATVVLHGCEIWARPRLRDRRLLRRSGVRAVVASTFSAGALLRTCPATVVNPGVAPWWYDTLVSTAAEPTADRTTRELVTTFRLADWREKGLDTILRAVELLADDRIRLTVCGTGPVPADLAGLVARYPWCRLAVDLPDAMLAGQLAAADAFVLATRTRSGRGAYGEGFGLALLEAQLAGTPVVAPPFGGSSDAFQPGLTGVAPVDESPEALAQVLGDLLGDDRWRKTLAAAAAGWSRTRFEPRAYGQQLVRALLGESAARPAQVAAASGASPPRVPAR